MIMMQAKQLDAKLPLPLYGLAQLNLRSAGLFKTCISLLESALQQVPGWHEALQVWCCLLNAIQFNCKKCAGCVGMKAGWRPV